MLDISVVIPTYRREKLVREAISSALTQRVAELEVIVVDDIQEGTARASVESVGDPRVRYVRTTRPSGARRESSGTPARIFDLAMRVRTGGELHVSVSQNSLNTMDVDAGAK